MTRAAVERLRALREDVKDFVCTLEESAVEWLGLRAFLAVFLEAIHLKCHRFNSATRYAEIRLETCHALQGMKERYEAFCLEHTREMLEKMN